MTQMLIKSPNIGIGFDLYAYGIRFDGNPKYAEILLNGGGVGVAEHAIYDRGSLPVTDWSVYEEIIPVQPTGNGQYLMRVDIIKQLSGRETILIESTPGLTGQWLDIWDYSLIQLKDDYKDGIPEAFIIHVSIAEDDGGGNPTGEIFVKRWKIMCYTSDEGYIIFDQFIDTLSTDLIDHTPDTDTVGDGYVAVTGEILIGTGGSSNVNTAPAFYVIDSGLVDHEIAIISDVTRDEEPPPGIPLGVIGRYQDSNNYWKLSLSDGLTSNPLIELIKVIAGTPTVVASKTLTGTGLIPKETPVQTRLSFSGNEIRGAVDLHWPLVEPAEITFTDPTFNTATKCGVFFDGFGIILAELTVIDSTIGYNPIVWNTDPLTSSRTKSAPSEVSVYFYADSDSPPSPPPNPSTLGYFVASVPDGRAIVINEKATPFAPATFLVKYENVSGDTSLVKIGGMLGQSGVWGDLRQALISLLAENIGDSWTAVIDVTVGVNDGTGSPMPGYNVTKRVTLTATATA